jgi:multisubunit Na+/H+ antiporter MnhB subunit
MSAIGSSIYCSHNNNNNNNISLCLYALSGGAVFVIVSYLIHRGGSIGSAESVEYIQATDATNGERGKNENGASCSTSQHRTPPNYLVMFCVGVLLTLLGYYYFGNLADENINNVMKEIDVNEPPF